MSVRRTGSYVLSLNHDARVVASATRDSPDGEISGAQIPFVEFPKIARLSREIIITEKIDGTNGVVYISEDGNDIRFGSRTRWLSAKDDNFGFWRWCNEHTDELLTLGPGTHFGEWWGSGIQRGYGLPSGEKRLSLFNAGRWVDRHGTEAIDGNQEYAPACCYVVPILYDGVFNEEDIDICLDSLRRNGSAAAPGFNNPEGVIIWHSAARTYFKKTLHKDDEYKGKFA